MTIAAPVTRRKEKSFGEKKALAQKQLRVVSDYVQDLILMADIVNKSEHSALKKKKEVVYEKPVAEPEFQLIDNK